MSCSLERTLAWFEEQRDTVRSFPRQVEQYPNDGVHVLQPILPDEREFAPKLHRKKNESPLYHAHQGFVLMYMYRGGCMTSMGDQPLMLNEGDILLLSPNVMHRNAITDEDDWMFHCQIDPGFFTHVLLPIASDDVLISSFILDFIEDASGNSHLYFPGYGHYEDIRSAFEALLMEYVDHLPSSRPLIRCRLAYFFMQLACKRYQTSPQTPEEEFSEFMSYISQHYAHTTLRQMAEHFHYNPHYLSSLIHKKTGKGFSQLVQSYRLSRACFLLEHSSFSTEEIAFQVGYKDISSLYKAYKRCFGVSPRMNSKQGRNEEED